MAITSGEVEYWFTIYTIAANYVSYVQTHFSDATVVLDGYEDHPSTEYHEHMRRMAGKKVSHDNYKTKLRAGQLTLKPKIIYQ